MSGKSHDERIRLITCGAGCTPDFQILSKPVYQTRDHFLVQKLPLIRIAVKFRNVDRQIVDKFFKTFGICLQTFYIIFITGNTVFAIKVSILRFICFSLYAFKSIFVSLYTSFKILIVIYHRLHSTHRKTDCMKTCSLQFLSFCFTALILLFLLR